MWEYRAGGVFGLHLSVGARSIFHNGSADLIDAKLAELRADLLLVGLAGRRGTHDYLGRLVRLLRPALVVPTHFDDFFCPLAYGPRLLPGIDLEGFLRDVERSAPAARVVLPTYRDVLAVPLEESAGHAVFEPWQAASTPADRL